MKRFILLLLSLIAAGAMLFSCEGNAGQGGNENENENGGESSGEGNGDQTPAPAMGSNVGNTCYTFSADLTDGSGKVSLKDLRGKVVVINFWGTWCDPCRSELPHFDEAATNYDGEVVILAIHSTYESKELPKTDFISENYENSKIIFADDEELNENANKFYSLLGGNGAYPMTLILDTNGVITYKVNEAIDAATLTGEIEKALNK